MLAVGVQVKLRLSSQQVKMANLPNPTNPRPEDVGRLIGFIGYCTQIDQAVHHISNQFSN